MKYKHLCSDSVIFAHVSMVLRGLPDSWRSALALESPESPSNWWVHPILLPPDHPLPHGSYLSKVGCEILGAKSLVFSIAELVITFFSPSLIIFEFSAIRLSGCLPRLDSNLKTTNNIYLTVINLDKISQCFW